MAMADCEGEKTIHYEEDGWSVTLTRYVSMELGETVASWVEFPNGWYLQSDDADAEFTQDGAKTYLQRLKSVWMESPFWDSVGANGLKPALIRHQSQSDGIRSKQFPFALVFGRYWWSRPSAHSASRSYRSRRRGR